MEHYFFYPKHVRVKSRDNFADSYQYSISKYLNCSQIIYKSTLLIAIEIMIAKVMAEAVTQWCSVRKVFLEISQNSQETTYARVSFLIKSYASDLQLY